MSYNETYWASKSSDEMADAVVEKFNTYQEWGSNSGYFARIQHLYNTYYAVDTEGSLALQKTEDGKLTKIHIGHFKNLIKRLHILITTNKLAFEARAINSDSESQLDADLARGLLEFYQNEKKLGSKLSESVETSLVCLEASIHCPWDDQKGAAIAAEEVTNEDTGETSIKTIYEGDQEFEVVTALDCARTTTLENSPWKILKLKRHKYTLAAQYPEHNQSIINSTNESDDELSGFSTNTYILDPTASNNLSGGDDETVTVYHMYHERNPALPEGREVIVCGGVVLYDRSLRYETVPVFTIKAGKVIDSVWGDSPAVDIAVIQQAIDLLSSATLTNNIDNAKQNIYTVDPNLTVTRLSESQNLITATQPPQGINFTASSPETYKLLDSYVSQQQLISGVNETARGAPKAASASGTSMALMLAQAQQFVSDLQAGYAELAGDVGSLIIDNLKLFAKTERIAYISGVKKRSYAKRFKAEDLYGVDRIIVTLGNPMTQSMSGRYDLMQQFMQYNIVRDPVVLGHFLRTGEIESATEDTFGDAILIRDENQMLQKGELPIAVIADMHPQHFMKHKELFSDPEVRKNPELMALITQHMQDHIDLHKSMDPDMAAIMGLQPLPSQMQQASLDESQGMPGEMEDQDISDARIPPGTPPGTADQMEEINEQVSDVESSMLNRN